MYMYSNVIKKELSSLCVQYQCYCLKFDEMNQELTELRELASSRLSELESLQLQYQENLHACEQLKMDVGLIYTGSLYSRLSASSTTLNILKFLMVTAEDSARDSYC